MPLYLTYHKTGGVLSKFPEVIVVPSHNLVLFPEYFATPRVRDRALSRSWYSGPVKGTQDISFKVWKTTEVYFMPINTSKFVNAELRMLRKALGTQLMDCGLQTGGGLDSRC